MTGRYRRCQIHDTRPAIVRTISPSAAGTPMVRDQCEECFTSMAEGFSMFGNTLDEVEIFDQRAEELMEKHDIQELSNAEVRRYYG